MVELFFGLFIGFVGGCFVPRGIALAKSKVREIVCDTLNDTNKHTCGR